MPTRRELLALAGASLPAAATMGCLGAPVAIVNDVHAQLNPTRVARIAAPASEDALRAELEAARAAGQLVGIAGGRHAMGGQQFARDGTLIDTRAMNRILSLDKDAGLVEVEAGIQWPELVAGLTAMQAGDSRPWAIIQKQTGADQLTLGGALAANVHGRGLELPPIIGDVDSFTIMDADGRLLTCSRTEHAELFRLAVGGYGLFGIMTRIRLRLMPRTKLERVVEIIDVDALMPAFEQRIAEGCLYGDCQFSTDAESEDFLRVGVFSCYRPLPPETAMPDAPRELGEEDWRKLYYLSHADKRRAYEAYSSYYLSTSGQRYWSDSHQLGVYIPDYHDALDRQLGAKLKGTEMITELYVPRAALGGFLADARDGLRRHGGELIYGTIRLIARDGESFLAWAREPWACVVMNLHVNHSPDGIAKAADDFQRLIDIAMGHGGSYYLTYHRWARRDQVERCYPQMARFLALKRRYDPEEVFVSDWYRHHREMFADAI